MVTPRWPLRLRLLRHDQTSASLVTVRYPDGSGDSRSFTPTVRQYDIQRVDGLPQHTVTPAAGSKGAHRHAKPRIFSWPA